MLFSVYDQGDFNWISGIVIKRESRMAPEEENWPEKQKKGVIISCYREDN